jgi:hypothetical protein
MAIKWHRLTCFGLILTLPMIVLLRKVMPEKITAFQAYREVLRDCKTCDKLFPTRLLAMTAHLEDVHGIEENTAIEIVADLAQRFRIAKYAKWDKK